MAFKHFWVQYKLDKEADQAYIKSENFVIGRAPECDLPIPTDVVSRRHLKITLEDDKIFVKDLGSTNGTYLQGERLEPHEKYEYKTGNRLYIDSGKKCSLRITAIFQRDSLDYDLEKKGLELERKKQELKTKNRTGTVTHFNTQHGQEKENFLNQATDSVDNIFENLVYIAKSARFNKEKQIREAEKKSQELIEKAQEIAAQEKERLQQEANEVRTQSESEAKRIVGSAQSKAEKILKSAKDKLKEIEKKSEETKNKAKEEAENLREDILLRAQNRHAEIIAEAKLKNEQLKDENVRFTKDIEEQSDKKDHLEEEISVLKKTQREHEEMTLQSKKSYGEELSKLNALKSKVSDLESQRDEALQSLNEEIPRLKENRNDLVDEIAESKRKVGELEADFKNLLKSIEDNKQGAQEAQEKAAVAEKRLDELNEKVIEAEDNLFKLSKIKQQRNAEIDKEIESRLQAQEEKEKQADKEIQKKKDRAAKEIDVNIANAKEKASKILADSREESQDILGQAEAESLALVEEAEKEALKLRNESESIKNKMEEELKEKYAAADARSEDMRRQAEEYSSKLRQEALSYDQKTRMEAENYEREKKKSADEYYGQKFEEADKYFEEKNSEADTYHKNKCSEADQYLKENTKEANRYYQKTKSEADQYARSTKEKADAYHGEQQEMVDAEMQARRTQFEEEIDKEKRQLLSDSRKEAGEILERAESKAAQMIEMAEKRAGDIVSETEGKASDEIARLEAEIESRKKETEEEIQDIRKQAVDRLEEQRKRFEEEEGERNRKRVLVLRKELNDVLRARITPFLKDTEQIDKVGGILGKTINAIMLDDVDSDILDTENFSDIDPSQDQKNVKKFYIFSGAGLAGIVLLFMLMPTIEQLFKDSGRNIAAQVAKDTKEQIEKVKQENDLSKEFHPEKVPEFKDSYTERVLYTEDYVDVELNKAYREQWILELQEFFIHELRLDENNLVPFIAHEANLIRELDSEMKKINGNFVDQGVERMEEIERDFLKKIKDSLKKKNDFKKVMEFKKKFFNENKGLAQP